MSLASRAFGRQRTARAALLIAAVLLGIALAVTIWLRRPQRASTPRPAPAPTPPDAAQTIEEFRFTSTLSGRRSYTIVADRLTGVSGGLHTLEGIRSIEIVQPDGRTLRGSADRGSFTEGGEGAEERGGGRLVLEGNVRIEGDAGERFASARIEYDQGTEVLESPGPCTFAYVSARGGSRPSPKRSSPPAPGDAAAGGEDEGPESTLSGEAGRLRYNLGSKEATLSDGVVLRLVKGGQVELTGRSDRAEADLQRGIATLVGMPARIDRDEDWLVAPNVRIEENDGKRRTLEAWPAARARVSRVPGRAHPEQGIRSDGGRADDSSAARAAGERILLVEEASGQGVVRDLQLLGRAWVQEERGTVDGPGPDRTAAGARRIEANTIRLRETAGKGERPFHAAGSVLVHLPPAPPETSSRTLACEELDGIIGPGGELTAADARGGVRATAGRAVATAERAKLAREDFIELRGGRPRVEEPERSIVADSIDFDTKANRIDASGRAQTRFTPRAGAAAGPFDPGQPVETSSHAARLTDSPRTGLFTGSVIARQRERALSANRLFVDDASASAEATGSVSVRTFRSESATAATSQRQRPVPVHINADTLLYDDRAKTTRLVGHAVVREPGRSLFADRITMRDGDDREGPEETLAEGHVVVEGEGKRGTGDEALHREKENAVTLRGKERVAEVKEIASGRTWRGPSLTWSLTPDSIPVASGESGRSRIVGPAPRRDGETRDGQADRRSSR